jgi:hypothetical protein
MSDNKRLALYQYPTSLSSPKIKPEDLTFFKRYGVIKANDYFGGKWEDLIEFLKDVFTLNIKKEKNTRMDFRFILCR